MYPELIEEYIIVHYRTTKLVTSIKAEVGQNKFYTTLFTCIKTVPSIRYQAIDYNLNNCKDVPVIDPDLVETSLITCLDDTNILVQRSCLELLSTRDLFADKDNKWGSGVDLIKSALSTLLRRDSSLNR